MGKKKKAKGGGLDRLPPRMTHYPRPSPSTLEVSSVVAASTYGFLKVLITPEAEAKVLALLVERAAQGSWSTNTGRNRVTRPRLVALYEALVTLGLTLEWIERAVTATVSMTSTKLDHALDWICLFVPHDELPHGYSDKAYGNSDGTAIIVPATPQSPAIISDFQKQDELDATPSVSKTNLTLPNTTASMSTIGETNVSVSHSVVPSTSTNKNWILNRFAEWSTDEDSETEQDLAEPVAPADAYRALLEDTSRFVREASAAKAAGDSKRQKELGRSIRETKAKMADLVKKGGFDAALITAEHAISAVSVTETSAVAPDATGTDVTSDDVSVSSKIHDEFNWQGVPKLSCSSTGGPPSDEDGCEVDIFDYNNDGSESDGDKAKSECGVSDLDDCEYSTHDWPHNFTSKGWTGLSPRDLLAEVVRRKFPGAPSPRFLKLGTRGSYTSEVIVLSSAKAELARAANPDSRLTSTVSEAQGLAATLALFQLVPEEAVHLRLPPPFRTVWQSLCHVAASSAKSAAKASTARRDAFIDSIIETLTIVNAPHADTDANFRAVIPNEMHSDCNDDLKALPSCIDQAKESGSGKEKVLDDDDDDWETKAEDGYNSNKIENGASEVSTQASITKTVFAQEDRAVETNLSDPDSSIAVSANVKLMRLLTSGYASPAALRLKKQRAELPVAAEQKAILKMVGGSQVSIIGGETGCGKSTQVPQFLLEDAILTGRGGRTQIICTQPRRISAISIAARVCAEMGPGSPGDHGTLTGYKVRLDTKVSSSARLIYCTTGVLLRQLQTDPTLTGVSHVVIDEVHERSCDSDFLMLLLKRMLKSCPALRVVLMSATMDAEKLSAYFWGCPVCLVPGRTFPVKEFYLEDAVEATGYICEFDSDYSLREHEIYHGEVGGAGKVNAGGRNRMYADEIADGVTRATLEAERHGERLAPYEARGLDPDLYQPSTVSTVAFMDLEKINFDLIELLLLRVISTRGPGAVLIFLPGIGEIRTLYSQLVSNREFYDGGRYEIVPLHSSVSNADQARAFKIPPNGTRKVVLSTNIAETGVTIPDCVYVIDSCKVKETQYRTAGSMQCLTETFISRAAAKQRTGRAGRVQPGECFRMVTRRKFGNFMAHTEPEIRRMPLEGVVLHLLASNAFAGNTPQTILSEALDPPATQTVANALKALTDVGAVEHTVKDDFLDASQVELAGASKAPNLTPLGRHLSRLPVDIRLGKMMILAAIFDCADQACTIAAAVGYKSPLLTPFGKAEEAGRAHRALAPGCDSDLVLVERAVTAWQRVLKNGGQAAAERFCRHNFLCASTLGTLEAMKTEYMASLVAAGFTVKPHDRKIPADDQRGIGRILRAVISAGFYPQVGSLVPSGKGGLANGVTLSSASAQIHPSSMIHPSHRTPSQTTEWLIYGSKVKTSQVFLRECTVVSPVPLLLFGGSITVHHTECVATVDRWIKFQASPRTAVIFKTLRRELDRLLALKIERPGLDIAADPLVLSILELIRTEGQ